MFPWILKSNSISTNGIKSTYTYPPKAPEPSNAPFVRVTPGIFVSGDDASTLNEPCPSCSPNPPIANIEVGTKLMVKLPGEYSESPGVPVNAEIVEVPFRESVNPNKREVQAAKGLDYAD